MKNLARGSVFLGLLALIGVLFYFQPTAEAKPAFIIANDSQTNLQPTIKQTEPTIQQSDNQINQTQTNQITIQDDNQDNSNDGSEMVVETRNFRATAYCLKGRMANGSSVRRGVVAADPRVLPLGTRIEVNAGSYSGTYTVADTGGAVKGRILDIWVPTCAEANRFGRRNVKVSVLSRRKRNRS